MLMMRGLRVCADLSVAFLLVVANVALLPIRLCAGLAGGLLVFAGLVGLPVWVVQLVISTAGGGAGGGPLSPWQMCALLAAAIPAGVALLQIANLGLGSGSTAGGGGLDRPEITTMGAHDPAGAASGRSDVSGATVPLGPVQAATMLRRLTRHELRLRAVSRQVAANKRRRRGEH